jgi:methyl-accepting chemotaxis protein
MSIPLCVVILLAAKLGYDSYKYNDNLKQLDKVIILSTKIGALVHETQKERGMTAGYLGSKGTKFQNKLPSQRNLTDNKLQDIKAFLSNFNENNYSQEFRSNLENSLQNLTRLSKQTQMPCF